MTNETEVSFNGKITVPVLAHSLEWMMDPTIRSGTEDRATPEKYVVAATGVLDQFKPVMDEHWNAAIDAALASTDIWITPGDIKLRAGEMTAQEMRSVLAINNAIRAGIKRLKIEPPVHR